MAGRRSRVVATMAAFLGVLTVVTAAPAQAAVTVTRAEVNSGSLRIEGSAAASRAITVDGTQLGTSSSTGSFRIERSGYVPPPDCTVDVNDGSTVPVNVRLAGCTVSAPPPPSTAALDTVTVSPSTVTGGSSASATVTLTAPAPAGGAVVEFSSSSPTVVTVPASLTVPAGVNSRVVPTFVSTAAVGSTTSAVVSATYNGVTRTATVTVTPPPPPQPGGALDSLSLSPATVQTGTTSTSATLTFTALTPTGGATVSLASSNPSVATVPASVTVPANSSTGAFPVTIAPSAAGTATISATYAGVTRTAVLTVTNQSLFRITTTSPLPNARVGENYAGFIEACCGQGTPYRWSLVSGAVPSGLRFAGDSLRLTQTTGVTGVPTSVQTSTFTVRARDQAGNTATRTFTLTVDPASPLVVTNGTSQLTDGTVGAAYANGLFAGGGVPPYTWALVAGSLPPGLSLQASPGRVLGTPTTAGTFTFTVRVTDTAGATATQQFTIRVLP